MTTRLQWMFVWSALQSKPISISITSITKATRLKTLLAQPVLENPPAPLTKQTVLRPLDRTFPLREFSVSFAPPWLTVSLDSAAAIRISQLKDKYMSSLWFCSVSLYSLTLSLFQWESACCPWRLKPEVECQYRCDLHKAKAKSNNSRIGWRRKLSRAERWSTASGGQVGWLHQWPPTGGVHMGTQPSQWLPSLWVCDKQKALCNRL